MKSNNQKSFRITSLGNSGILLQTESLNLAVDPYFPDKTGEEDVSTAILEASKVDGFLISHDHWDHFDPDMLVRFALKYNSWIIGPGTVIRRLHLLSPQLRLIHTEPDESLSMALPGTGNSSPGSVTVYRTPHGRVHVSYLVETPEARVYFDADNHDTRILPAEDLKFLDAMFIYPWKQSGWKEFIKTVNPALWFLVHLSKKEMDEYRNGKYPACLGTGLTRKPEVLIPGESRRISGCFQTPN